MHVGMWAQQCPPPSEPHISLFLAIVLLTLSNIMEGILGRQLWRKGDLLVPERHKSLILAENVKRGNVNDARTRFIYVSVHSVSNPFIETTILVFLAEGEDQEHR